jgi:hypothetical protein
VNRSLRIALATLGYLGCLLATPACGAEAEHAERGEGHAPAVRPGRRAPVPDTEVVLQWPDGPPELAPAPEPPPLPEPLPEQDERKRALADIGTKAFEALRGGELEALLELTPEHESGVMAELCPGLVGSSADPSERKARFDHCHRSIDWDRVDRADVFTGELVAEQAAGCEAGISDYGRLQLFLHMNDGEIWRVDFLGAVGKEQQTLGIDGSVVCRTVDSAPTPR